MAKLKVKFDDPAAQCVNISVSDGVDGRLMRHALSGPLSASSPRPSSAYWMTEKRTLPPGWKSQINPDGPLRNEGLVAFEALDPDSPSTVFRLAGSYAEVCLPFWRALRGLEG